jgi:hypothetical protein
LDVSFVSLPQFQGILVFDLEPFAAIGLPLIVVALYWLKSVARELKNTPLCLLNDRQRLVKEAVLRFGQAFGLVGRKDYSVSRHHLLSLSGFPNPRITILSDYHCDGYSV